MMEMGKHKPGVAILIASKADKRAAADEGDDGDGQGGLEAMKALIKAIKADDPETALEEYLNLQDCCGGDM